MRSSESRHLPSVLLLAVALFATVSCGSAPASKTDAQPDSVQLEALQHLLGSSYAAEEAFGFETLEELRGRSSIGVVVTIAGIEPGPAEIIAQLDDGATILNETLAISLVDNEGKEHILVQDYGEAVSFDAIASQFPVGATAVLFGVPYTPPEKRTKSEHLDKSKSAKWQLAHPLGFLVRSSDRVLIPLFSEGNSSLKASTEVDKEFLRSIGLEVSEIRWPKVDGA